MVEVGRVDIAVVFSVWHFPHLRRVMRGLAEFAQHQGNWALTPMAVRDFEVGAVPRGVQFAGAICQYPSDRAHVIDGLQMPKLTIRPQGLRSAWPWAGPDYRAIGRLAASHFIERGYLSLAYLSPPPGASCPEVELIGASYVERAAEAGRSVQVHRAVPPGFSGGRAAFEEQYEALASFLGSAPAPLALLCSDEGHAWRVLEACRRAHLHVPHEVAPLAVCWDEFTCEIASPTLSSIWIDFEEIGRMAGRLMARLIRGEDIPHRNWMDRVEVQTRQSTGTIATTDPDVSIAVSYIARHLGEELTAYGIAEAAAVSVRTLHRKFTATLGRSVKDEVRRQRIERATQLLRTTGMPLADIGRVTGIGQQSTFSRAIRKATGQTPRQYRDMRR